MSVETLNKKKGFSPESEVEFLRRVNQKDLVLRRELTTQLAEDFGMIEFSKKYVWQNGKIIDLESGEGVVDLTLRGGINAETEAIKKIEVGLSLSENKTWVHFSPKNNELGYDQNCVDFWRRLGNNEVVWNRIVVINDFKEMIDVYKILGGDEIKDEMEILSKPISSELKLASLFSVFRMANKINDLDYKEIDEAVLEIIKEFEREFGNKISSDKDLVLRLYSAAYDRLTEKTQNNFGRNNLDDLYIYMYAPILNMREERSYGCAGSTSVANFREGFGYYVVDGVVKYGEVPEDFKFCKKCGCYYSGNKCPFC